MILPNVLHIHMSSNRISALWVHIFNFWMAFEYKGSFVIRNDVLHIMLYGKLCQSELNGNHKVSSSGRYLAVGQEEVGVQHLAFLRNLFFLAKLSLQKSRAVIRILSGTTQVKDQDSRIGKNTFLLQVYEGHTKALYCKRGSPKYIHVEDVALYHQLLILQKVYLLLVSLALILMFISLVCTQTLM